MNIETQSEKYLKAISTRKRSPVTGSTLDKYRGFLRNWILPVIGALDPVAVGNREMKLVVDNAVKGGLAASTVAGVVNVVMGIMASAVDSNGDEVYPRKWNHEFIDAPLIDNRKQHAPVISNTDLFKALNTTSGRFHTLIALLAGSGLRISEAQALKGSPDPDSEFQSYWDRERAVLVIKGAWMRRGAERVSWLRDCRGGVGPTKTLAGVREVDLCSDLNVLLHETVSGPGFIFSDDGREPWNKDKLAALMTEANIPGFHSLRRFRATHLENVGVPPGLSLFWIGHAKSSVHDRYVIYKDAAVRRDWAERAALGFEILKAQEAVTA